MTQLPNVTFASLTSETRAGTAVYFAAECEGLPAHLRDLDEASAGAISRALKVSAFKGKRKAVIEILAPHGLAAGRVLIVGTGDQKR